MLTHIKAHHLTVFILYLIILMNATFALGWYIGLHSSTTMVSKTLTFTLALP